MFETPAPRETRSAQPRTNARACLNVFGCWLGFVVGGVALIVLVILFYPR